MDEHKFRYVYRHDETGDIFTKIFTLDEIEAGISKFFEIKNIRLNRISRDRYTGRKTDNCEIYEGDMCIVTRFNPNGCDYQYKCIVEWLDGGFYFICEEKEMYIPVSEVEDTASDVEVIGNIHDNPELLKEARL